MALDGVLANIPGLAGYLAVQQNDQRQALGGLQGVMQLMQAVESAQQAPLKAQLMQSQVAEAQRANQERAQVASRLAEIQARYGPRTEQVTDTLPDDEMTGTPAQQVQRTVQRPMDLAGAAGELMFVPGMTGVAGNILGTVEAQKGRQEQARLAQQTELTRLQAQMQDRALTREQQERISQRMEQLRRDMADQASADRFAMAGIAAGNRQPPAPVVTEIQDPNNPDRMIKIDARTGSVIGVAPNTKSTEQMERATERLSKQLEQAKVPQVQASISTLNNVLASYAQRNAEVPGIGYAKNLPMANFFLSQDGKDVKSSVARVANDLLSMYSGMAVTLPEAERRALEEMRSGAFSAADFTRAWPATVNRFNLVKGNVRAGYDPKVIDTYSQRPGAVSMAPIQPAFGLPQVANDADFAKLPSGTKFVGPDGVERVKP